jgi:AraC family transcriptional regulator of adaptative response / DNA-3-methyladenine glycosylase II
LSGRLVDAFGTRLPISEGFPTGLTALFPTAEELARVPVAQLRTIGLPEARAATLCALANQVASGAVDIEGPVNPLSTIAELQKIRGVGPWTANYVAMRAMRWPDAFVAGDLGVWKSLRVTNARAAELRAEAWRPWRAYAVMHLWHSLAKENP